jgi:hypothetical protein
VYATNICDTSANTGLLASVFRFCSAFAMTRPLPMIPQLFFSVFYFLISLFFSVSAANLLSYSRVNLIAVMSTTPILPCDGCGQPADPAHIARRLERLAWSTRFRPLHIQALLLAPIAPASNDDFLYSPSTQFDGEAGTISAAVQLTQTKSFEAALTEFQKLGVMLAHVLECPLDPGTNAAALIKKQLPLVITRIRRSLKPKRILLLGNELGPFASKLHETDLSCPVLPAAQGVFLSTPTPTAADLAIFREALALINARSA